MKHCCHLHKLVLKKFDICFPFHFAAIRSNKGSSFRNLAAGIIMQFIEFSYCFFFLLSKEFLFLLLQSSSKSEYSKFIKTIFKHYDKHPGDCFKQYSEQFCLSIQKNSQEVSFPLIHICATSLRNFQNTSYIYSVYSIISHLSQVKITLSTKKS